MSFGNAAERDVLQWMAEVVSEQRIVREGRRHIEKCQFQYVEVCAMRANLRRGAMHRIGIGHSNGISDEFESAGAGQKRFPHRKRRGRKLWQFRAGRAMQRDFSMNAGVRLS